MADKHAVTIGDLEGLELSKPATIFGLQMKGHLYRLTDHEWHGTLAHPQVVGGWPCVSRIRFTASGRLLKCYIDAPHAAFGLVFPEGTRVDMSDPNHLYDFFVPAQSLLIQIDPETGKPAWPYTSPDGYTYPKEVNRMAVDFQEHVWTLTRPREVAGTRLPAGTRLEVRYDYDMQKRDALQLGDVSVIHLSRPARILGVRAQGTWTHGAQSWSGELAGAQEVDGWYCRGEIRILKGGSPRDCTFARTRDVFGYRLPEGTQAEFDPHYLYWRFELPDGTSLEFSYTNSQLAKGQLADGKSFNAEQGDPVPTAIRQLAVH